MFDVGCRVSVICCWLDDSLYCPRRKLDRLRCYSVWVTGGFSKLTESPDKHYNMNDWTMIPILNGVEFEKDDYSAMDVYFQEDIRMVVTDIFFQIGA